MENEIKQEVKEEVVSNQNDNIVIPPKNDYEAKFNEINNKLNTLIEENKVLKKEIIDIKTIKINDNGEIKEDKYEIDYDTWKEIF